jgi:hypothetical protein
VLIIRKEEGGRREGRGERGEGRGVSGKWGVVIVFKPPIVL